MVLGTRDYSDNERRELSGAQKHRLKRFIWFIWFIVFLLARLESSFNAFSYFLFSAQWKCAEMWKAVGILNLSEQPDSRDNKPASCLFKRSLSRATFPLGLGEAWTQLSHADDSEVSAEDLGDLFYRYMSSLWAPISGFFQPLPDAHCSFISRLFTQQAVALRTLGAAIIADGQIFTTSNEVVACMTAVRGLSENDDITNSRAKRREGAEQTFVPTPVRGAQDAFVEDEGQRRRLKRAARGGK